MTGCADEMITVATKTCMFCGLGGEVTVPVMGLELWGEGKGLYIQEAFYATPAPIREQLLTGTHPACWDAAFPPDEDEDEPDREPTAEQEAAWDSREDDTRGNSL